MEFWKGEEFETDEDNCEENAVFVSRKKVKYDFNINDTVIDFIKSILTVADDMGKNEMIRKALQDFGVAWNRQKAVVNDVFRDARRQLAGYGNLRKIIKIYFRVLLRLKLYIYKGVSVVNSHSQSDNNK